MEQRNATDKVQIQSAEKRANRLKEQACNDMRQILSTPEGRRFIWGLLGFCRINESSYDPSGSKVYFQEGIRNVGLKVLADVHNANADAYVTMMKEAKGRKDNGE